MAYYRQFMIPTKKPLIYQAKNGALELREDVRAQTVWASQRQMAEIFDVNSQAITKHVKNIYGEGELKKEATCSKMEQVEIEGSRQVSRRVNFYNLDVMISVGYRINSKVGTKFRQWATGVLKSYVLRGYALNEKFLAKRREEALRVIEDIKALSAGNHKVSTDDILELIKAFSGTWFSLRSYDEAGLPQSGFTKKDVSLTADELYADVALFKRELTEKGEATELFAQERQPKSLEGIVGNVLQAVFGKDAYGTVEEKAAHLLYFVIKNHPFTDGNKRTGAFSFVWFLRRTEIDFSGRITPETLTTLTLLIAESKPSDKDRMIGLVLLLLRKPS